ncbi:MAG TPA: lasso peptide biosynthesis PqqD family chaperone [Actinomycetota bacterium]
MRSLDIPEEVLSRDIDGEAVLLDLRSGRYFGLNATGARMWALLKDGLELEAAAAGIVDEFDVDVEQARADVQAFVDSLVERGLAKVRTRA